jgi:hypothetical protein
MLDEQVGGVISCPKGSRCAASQLDAEPRQVAPQQMTTLTRLDPGQ